MFFLIKHKLVCTVFTAVTDISSSHTVNFAQLENRTKSDFLFFSVLAPLLLTYTAVLLACLVALHVLLRAAPVCSCEYHAIAHSSLHF